MHYLGYKVELDISDTKRKQLNRLKSWKYGYDPTIDTVIISKDGTLGDVYNIQGLNVGLPEKPSDSEILNYKEKLKRQKWKRHELPEQLSDQYIAKATAKCKDEVDSQKIISDIYSDNFDYIEREFKRRDEGVWIFIKGIPLYIVGTYYYGIQWLREEVDYPNFRVIQSEYMIFWEACKADSRSYGLQYVKNRRIGASLMGIMEMLESTSITENKISGIISKKGSDSSKIFRRLVNGFKRLPLFFKPITDGTNTPKKQLIFDEPTKRRKKGEPVTAGEGLSSMIEWHNTDLNAMDGDAIFRSLLDESGKYPTEVPFSKYWRVVKTSHTKGVRITGKSMVVSTVNSFKKGGAEYKTVWDESDLESRDANGQTKSGLYRIFIPAKYCLEGKFDEYGFTIVDDPIKPVKTDEGIYTKEGTITWLINRANALKSDPEAYNEHKRQFPDTIQDAFRDASNDCEFNLQHLQEQIDHNNDELNDRYDDNKEWMGNDDVERGNFQWEDGIQDTKVKWVPDNEKGRFFIKKGCHPPKEFRNSWEMKYANENTSKSPLAGHIGAFGVDPYNRTKSSDGRGSKGCIILTTREHTCDELPKNAMILEYIDRPKKVTLFFEEVIMASVYYSIPFLAEQSNDQFLAYVKDRGYRNFSMNNPFKRYDQLNPQEKEFGGAPQQDSKIGEAQFYATEAAVQDHFGVARDGRHRLKGQMGDMPFTRTVRQIKDVDTSNRTKYDAYIGYSLSRVACQKRLLKQAEKPKAIPLPFTRYNNSGKISKSS